MLATLVVIVVALLALLLNDVHSFRMNVIPRSSFLKSGQLKMEYIPDGLTKEQWAAIKKKVIELQTFKGVLVNLLLN